MSDDTGALERDEIRMESAIQTIKDVMVRFEETAEGTRTVYDILGFVMQDLLREGLCPACLSEVASTAFMETGSSPETHREDEDSVYH
jgi:hypothetical protein